jgi:hypothetical protein
MSSTITLSLDSFIELALGSEKKGCRELPDYETGLIANELYKDSTLYKIQFEEFDGCPLMYPKLWSYDEWYTSSTKYKRDKLRADIERVRGWIFDANVKIVTKHLVRELLFDEDRARANAYSLLTAKKYGNIRALGIKKLITKEEELR